MKRLVVVLCTLCLGLAGCASVAREPDALELVRVLGVDGGGPVTLTAVCGGDISRGTAQGELFESARRGLPWSGAGKELSLTGVSYLVVGPDVDPERLLLAVLEDVDLGAGITVWLAPEGASALLDACKDPAADLELLILQGVSAPTVAQAAAALTDRGMVTLPCLIVREGRAEDGGMLDWNKG